MLVPRSWYCSWSFWIGHRLACCPRAGRRSTPLQSIRALLLHRILSATLAATLSSTIFVKFSRSTVPAPHDRTHLSPLTPAAHCTGQLHFFSKHYPNID